MPTKFYSVIYFLHASCLLVCAAKVELVVLIDGSGSVNRGGLGSFRRTLNVVKRVVNGFEVTNDRVHVGVIIFATGPRVCITDIPCTCTMVI